MTEIKFPHGENFAFTIFDDTDFSTLENTRPVYDFLEECGFRTTKSVWPIRGTNTPLYGGATCEDNEYRNWLLALKTTGFEIEYHMATYHSSPREETINGLNRFKHLFGASPKVMANHSKCRENIYWGDARLSGLNKLVYNCATGFKYHNKYRGHIENDPYFWGDICQKEIKYCRNFVFGDINTLNACPQMPYHDNERPYVNFWFSSSEGGNCDKFVSCINESAQDRLEREGGVCIMYTHFAAGFFENGKLNERFVQLMKRLSRKKGWFAPVSEVLDFLKEKNGGHVITDSERNKLERRWLKHKFRIGHS